MRTRPSTAASATPSAATVQTTTTLEPWAPGTSPKSTRRGCARRALVLALVIGFIGQHRVSGADPLDQWTPLNPLPTANRLNAVAYGGDRYVAVGELGTLITSTNAIAWATHETGTSADLHGVAWGTTDILAGRFVAVGDRGVVVTSDDGAAWAATNVGETVRLRSVAFGLGRFIAVGEDAEGSGEGEIWSSMDGLAWTRNTVSELPPLNGVTADADAVWAVGSDGRVLSSRDGLVWESTASGLSQALIGVTTGGGSQMAVGTDGGLTRSADEGAWEVIGTGIEEWLYGVAFGSSPGTALPVYVAVGAGGMILSSFDGATWQTRTTGWDATLRAVTYGAAGFVAVGDHGTIRHWFRGLLWAERSVGPRDWMVGMAHGNGITVAGGVYFDAFAPANSKTTLLVSTNGTTWTQRSPGDFWLHGLTHAQGLFVAVGSNINGDAGRILSSADGINWTTRASATDWLFAVTQGNGRFVAVGENWLNFTSNSVCLISTNGINWEGRDSGTMQELAAVTWGEDRFVAVGHRGTTVLSLNGDNWTAHASGSSEYLRGVAWGNGLFVAVGHTGTLLTSPDGIDWTARDSGTQHSLIAVAHNGQEFVVCGSEGMLLHSADGIAWTSRFTGSHERFSSLIWTGDAYLLSGSGGVLLESGHVGDASPSWRQPTVLLEPDGDSVVRVMDSHRRSSDRSLLRPMRGEFDTNVHHFAAIRGVTSQGVELALDGAIPAGFEYDLFPVETSEDLSDWQPWQTFLRTNADGRTFLVWDISGDANTQRFYRTATNLFPVTAIQPSGPYPVGRALRWVTLHSHPVRRTFLTCVYYPAQTQTGQVPAPFFQSKLTGRYALRNNRTESEFRTVRTHALDEAPFATDLTPCPVILAGHGWYGSNNELFDRPEALASHGFVVVALDGADTFASLHTDGAGVMGVHPASEPSAASYLGRVTDALGVISQLTVWNHGDPLLQGRLMPDNVGIFGFSMGGAAAIDVAQSDAHCRAAVNLDGGVPQDYLRPGYSKAFLFIGSNDEFRDHPRVVREFAESLSQDALYFRIRNTTHAQLAEWHWWGDRRPRVRELTRRAITSFFLKHLKGVDDGFFDVLETEYPEVYDVVRR